ncbi:hypothetical protein FBZ93_10515 [Bradyrhizobium macuxiense]|uniref:Uncharacterized protein n=1 Tax=Bradyrhizobium macuxiense TaxID=1755647 RepID=A0A560LXS7_9BRAD|nr:hypothetical protein [Bradyrhizobium macuxiense]TWC00223.1 hypothetical protein FBZ93_10515 [Bradyrhizobium macuxiense]
MEIAQRPKLQAVQASGTSRWLTIMLGYAAFLIIFWVAVYLDAFSPGTAAGDFATMTAFP